ncbi:MAG: LTA synthase family protein [Bdellovibrionota bacterium]
MHATTGFATLITLFCLLCHVSYLEHFGLTFRIAHLFSLQTSGFLEKGTVILFQSWRTYVLISVPLTSAIILLNLKPSLFASMQKHPLVLLVAAAILNSININTRYLPLVHKELRYNFFTALYFNIKEYHDIAIKPLPSKEQLLKIRELFPNRQWSQDSNYEKYPLWQKTISAPADNDTAKKSQSIKIKEQLRNFLQKKEHLGEHWNIVIVFLASGSSSDIGFLSENKDEDLMPNMSKIMQTGINFTETIASGTQTRQGQIAAMCSLYSIPGFPLMITSPALNSICLPDVYHTSGYSTFFLHAADNQFDNQLAFYKHHNTTKIIGKPDYPKNTSKGGWGYSDHALFNKTLSTLQGVDKPFFATVLTLTNHPPLTLPSDAPEEIKELKTARQRIIRYVDWAFADFYNKILKMHPNTLIILTSDQGLPIYKGPIQDGLSNSDYTTVKMTHHIPFSIFNNRLPPNLQGVKLNQLVSNTDIPPTLLSLFGKDSISQQFMGMDAFSRKNEPIYTIWFENFLRIQTGADQFTVSKVRSTQVENIATLGHYNHYAPVTDMMGHEAKAELSR